MTRKIFSWIALVLCEAILIAAFIIFRGELPTNVMVLDIVIGSVILGILFIDVFRTWDDEYTARLGSMGIRWTVTIIYAIIAIGLMLTLKEKGFAAQLLSQGALLVVLLLGMAAALRTKEQVISVHLDEKVKVCERDSVKQAWQRLLDKMDEQNEFPGELRERTNTIVKNLRYLSPTNGSEALETDRQIVECAESLMRMVGNYRMNKEPVERTIAKAERLMQQRRKLYSN